MNTHWNTPEVKKLANTLLSIEDKKTMLNFLRDLCTIEELHDLSIRWKVVQLLEKKKTYREIAEQTGLSTTTVTRIAHWLKHGEGGYKAMLKK